MFEKVNPSHPDKIADRIAGAIVDLAYTLNDTPQIAVEVLIGHGKCTIISESSVAIMDDEITAIVERIVGPGIEVEYREYPQDQHLADNQRGMLRCGDNGIFRGVPDTAEQRRLVQIARSIYSEHPTDGKYILDGNRLILCQSGDCEALPAAYPTAEVNPLGPWVGGLDVDTGATNRKLGSDMGDSITGGGLHGKDLSKADVSVNVFAWFLAQITGKPVEMSCAIGDTTVGGYEFSHIVNVARAVIASLGGFEGLAEWGLVGRSHFA